MVVEDAQLVHLGRALPHEGAPGGHVFAVLAAARVGAEGRRHEGEGVFHPVIGHLPQGVPQQRAPVAVAPVHGQLRPPLAELDLQGRDQGAALVADGALPAKVQVVLGHLSLALVAHGLAAQHVLEERQHLVGTLGAAERNHEQGVVVGHHAILPAPWEARVSLA